MANMHQNVKELRCNYQTTMPYFVLEISFVGYSPHVLTDRLSFCCVIFSGHGYCKCVNPPMFCRSVNKNNFLAHGLC